MQKQASVENMAPSPGTPPLFGGNNNGCRRQSIQEVFLSKLTSGNRRSDSSPFSSRKSSPSGEASSGIPPLLTLNAAATAKSPSASSHGSSGSPASRRTAGQRKHIMTFQRLRDVRNERMENEKNNNSLRKRVQKRCMRIPLLAINLYNLESFLHRSITKCKERIFKVCNALSIATIDCTTAQQLSRRALTMRIQAHCRHRQSGTLAEK